MYPGVLYRTSRNAARAGAGAGARGRPRTPRHHTR
uniref:Uncharacterized protein n=1 Tax=Siphoviridae sp. ctu1h4 TaxID=2826499 RepID=A0A8S5MWT3_9CAUD|nr:MAG TPA: hypothetical protein [Siphoviridae sp. ctu1h4]